MRQLLVGIAVGYVCIRCLVCGINGQIRECANGEPHCLDVDLRVQVQQPAAAPSRRYGPERWEPSPAWPEERPDDPWQLGSRREPQPPAAWQQRKRPRGMQLVGDVKLPTHYTDH